jgi:hypothetical protein
MEDMDVVTKNLAHSGNRTPVVYPTASRFNDESEKQTGRNKARERKTEEVR